MFSRHGQAANACLVDIRRIGVKAEGWIVRALGLSAGPTARARTRVDVEVVEMLVCDIARLAYSASNITKVG